MKKFWKGFKEFINRGSVVDMAVAVVVGGAFGKIVSSLVDNIIMPFFGAIFGATTFADLFFTINNAQIYYGKFIQAIIDFLLISFFVYVALRILLGAKGLINKKHNLTHKEIRTLKKQGKTKDEIKLIDKEKGEILMAEKKAKEAEAKANTTEAILKDIKNFLIEQNEIKKTKPTKKKVEQKEG